VSGARRFAVGVDVGGTFTDLFFFDEERGEVSVAKTPSTLGDQSRGFLEGLLLRLQDLGEIAALVHGTTVGTNALLERKGAPSGIITTAGFRDVLEMRRRDRARTWGLGGDFHPVVPRDRRFEVPERTLAHGEVRTPVDLEAVRAAALKLRELGAESLSVVFLNAYANPENERRAAALLREIWPNAFVNASSEILPEIREFERTSTTVLNAYLQPVVSSYLERLEGRLRERGAQGELLIVQSNGGVMTVGEARRLPVRTALSGPAAGVIAAREIARQAGFANVVTCDMGGTSFDVSLIEDYEPGLAAQTSLDFGMVIRSPMIEITTIGAGGGSIAWVDRGGMLQVGPESAGSDPGPVCYGAGGERPTVTDANLVLGRIAADEPIGGKIARLNLEAARAAIESQVGRPLGLGAEAAAEAILRVAASRMAGAVRLVSIERGHDPARFAAMPFGGGGGLFAGALLLQVGLARALVPRYPGVISALGCVIADMRHDFVETLNRPLDSLDVAELERRMADMAKRGAALLDSAGTRFERRSLRFELDMSYIGQTHTVPAPVPAPPGLPGAAESAEGGLTRELLRSAFERSYLRAQGAESGEFGGLLEGIGIRALNLRGAVTGHRPKLDLRALRPAEGASMQAAERPGREVYVDGAWRRAKVYARLELPVGAVIEGPAVLQQPDATVFVEPGLCGEIDELGNFVMRRADDNAAQQSAS